VVEFPLRPDRRPGAAHVWLHVEAASDSAAYGETIDQVGHVSKELPSTTGRSNPGKRVAGE
jgi:hypothetical protein